ncbi:hypothetical protein BKA67DRAFT_337672 [Truncatella angustata]|uniref:Uncharacterized protein n=1 Tax=Truncatella angustata TaxID=152316 RepID=A0A9P8ZWB2_9PEZI|nr:uncharacterized protein BKA67DRAFT_337672 [Truncatella angustata]KAH6651768.1 hypothetical protein BKA67DRAFT_337672 [Truncatella angustata]
MPSRDETSPESGPAEAEQEEGHQEEDDYGEEGVSLEDIVHDILPQLGLWAGKMCDHVTAAEPGAFDQGKWNKLSLYERKFDAFRQDITSADTFFIDPRNMRKSLAGFENSEYSGLVFKTIVSVNTALLLKLTLQISHGKLKAQPVLEELNKIFPALFKWLEDDTDDDLSAYDEALRIRCCVLADRIEASDRSNPAQLAAQIFCLGPMPGTIKSAKESLLNGPYEPFGDLDLDFSEGLKETHMKNMEKLCSHLYPKKSGDTLKFLRDTYPVKDLLKDLTKWAHQIYKDINKPPKDVKGKEPVRVAPSTEVTPEISQNEATSSGTPHKAASQSIGQQQNEEHMDKSNADKGDLFVDQDDQNYSSDSDSQPVESVVRTGPRMGSYLDGSLKFEPPRNTTGGKPRTTPPLNQQAVKNTLSKLNPEKIISILKASGSANGPGSSQAAPSRSQMNGRKRLAANHEDSEDNRTDDDDSFQLDERPLKRSRRPSIASQVPISSFKRARIPESQPARVNRSSRSARSDMNASDLRPDDIQRLTQEARAVARESREDSANRLHRPPQKREKWADEDTTALINAIPVYMCAWSDMENAGLFTTYRTQQQIRDKARNTKVDFLKADFPLPAGFDGVALGKKEIEAVRLLGKNPTRKEDDLDDSGRVINNKWAPEIEFEERRRRRRPQDAD